MLSILSPLNMAMNMPCCQYAPYCPHNHHRVQSQPLPSLSVGSTGDNASWSNRIPSHPPSQYSYNRTSQTPLFPSQTMNYLNDQDKLRSASNPYSSPPPNPTWTNPAYSGLNNEYGSSNWLPTRNKDGLQAAGSSSFSNDNNEYMPTVKYEGLELRDVSPSRTTDFSTVSASSHASPAPGPTYMGYAAMHGHKDDSPYLSSQPPPPEQLRAADDHSRRMSTASFEGGSPSSYPKPRSRKGSEVIQCQVCHKTFDRRSNFKSHWETHDKDRQRTACKMEGCKKTFGRPAEMTRHVNSAHRQKSFPCTSCGKDFTRHDILLRHCKDACPVLVRGKGSGKRRRSKAS